MKIFLSTLFLFVFQSAFSQTPTELYLKQHLRKLETDPQTAMSDLPPKYDSKGRRIFSAEHIFSLEEIQTSNFVEIKTKVRSQILPKQTQAGITPSNDWRKFFPRSNEVITNINSLEGQIQEATLTTAPWSSDYWPTYKGGIATRYNDVNYPDTEKAQDYIDYYEKNKDIDLAKAEIIDNLSPSEKYDILVGDENFTMTKWAWSEIKNTLESEKEIPTWFGLCHGWAPAAYMLPRPKKSVDIEIQNFKGTNFTLRLYPDDLKALATLLWANAQTPTYNIGGRCNEKEAKTDPANGRVLNPECFDVNPGSWHLTITNHIGVQNRSFVMDATWDHEVWNQPIRGYKITYFNPQSRRVSESVEKGLVKLSDYKKDPFKKYRNPQSQFVIGVNMEVTYVIETAASHAEADDEKSDLTRTVQYIYDLETDLNGNIIGGEWYQHAHPDFLWTPPQNARAISIVDPYLITHWNGTEPIPQDWRNYAPYASQYGQPMAKAIEVLLRRAQ